MDKADLFLSVLAEGEIKIRYLYMNTQNQRIATMTFSSVYPHYVAKLEKKGRTTEELH